MEIQSRADLVLVLFTLAPCYPLLWAPVQPGRGKFPGETVSAVATAVAVVDDVVSGDAG